MTLTDTGNGFRGQYTDANGHRIEMDPPETEALWESIAKSKAERAAKLPDERAALNAMHEAWTRLTELGWREASSCPKDGSHFDTIEAGSTGIFRCHYSGEWPDGSWWIEDGGDLWPARTILFRLDPEAEAARKQRMADAAARYRATREDP